MIKKLFNILICLSMIALLLPNVVLIQADEGEENPCEVDPESQDCRIKKATDSSKRITELNKEIAEANKDLKAAQKLATEYYEQAQSLQAEIDGLQVQINERQVEIDELTVKIDELTQRINENQYKVDVLNTRVLRRMEESQGQMHFNPLLDFILGANGFSDMLRRTYGVEAIMSKEKSDREQLIDTINQLNKDKAELQEIKTQVEEAKKELDAAQEDLINKQAEYNVMVNYYNQIVEETRAAIEEYQNQLEKEKRNYTELRTHLSANDVKKLPSIAGFYSPVPGASISGHAWFYFITSGDLHLGVDYAVSMGSPIYAPANGVILVSYNGCPVRGYLGNPCGGDGNGNGVSYGGNQIYMMTSVNNSVYAITFSHLQQAVVERYSVVMAGDLIGYVGSSGNSSGPHSHIELFYLGPGDMEDLYDIYLNKDYSLSFNCGWGWSAYNNTRCEVTGGVGPCRLNPEGYFGS